MRSTTREMSIFLPLPFGSIVENGRWPNEVHSRGALNNFGGSMLPQVTRQAHSSHAEICGLFRCPRVTRVTELIGPGDTAQHRRGRVCPSRRPLGPGSGQSTALRCAPPPRRARSQGEASPARAMPLAADRRTVCVTVLGCGGGAGGRGDEDDDTSTPSSLLSVHAMPIPVSRPTIAHQSCASGPVSKCSWCASRTQCFSRDRPLVSSSHCNLLPPLILTGTGTCTSIEVRIIG